MKTACGSHTVEQKWISLCKLVFHFQPELYFVVKIWGSFSPVVLYLHHKTLVWRFGMIL